jgi:hypothetical protein
MQTTSSRRRTGVTFAALLLAATLAGTTACGADKSTSPRGRPAGSYALQQVGGAGLPASLFSGPFTDPETGQHYDQLTIKVTAGAITLTAQSRFHLTVQLGITADGQSGTASLDVEGSYTTQGAEVTLNPDDQSLGAKVATLGSGALVLGLDPLGLGAEKPFRFRK